MKDMKNLFKGFVLTLIALVAFGGSLSAQTFKTATESEAIIVAEQNSALTQLESVDPNSGTYSDLKYRLKAYAAMTEVLSHEDASDAVVEEAIVTGIIAGTDGKSTHDEYLNDAIDDPVGISLKDHLLALLSN